jgi:hypothetical protein
MDRQRLSLEKQEAQRLLAEQRTLVAELEMKRSSDQAPPASDPVNAAEDNWETDSSEAPDAEPALLPTPCDLPDRLVSHYREMLRAYVVMGAGNLADEMATLGQLLTDAGISAQRTLHLHVHVLEELVGSLGNRSARHVMSRADLLVLEVMAHLADGYRRRYYEQHHPPQQQWLPGFDCSLPTLFSAADTA